MSKSTDDGDERLSRSGRNQSDARSERGQADRAKMATPASEKMDRLKMFRSQMFQSALPDLPKIPGYHVCWLTTTNPRDSIQQRTMLGYEPVKVTDLGDLGSFEHVTLKTGEYAGCIGVNEMLAYKLPQDLYEMYMHEAHHNAPLQEELKLKATLDLIKQQAESKGAEVIPEEGNAELGQDPASSSGRRLFEVV